MTHDEFLKRVKEEVAEYVGCAEHEVYFPWVAKVLQNSKVLASAPGKGVPYFEFTLNGDKNTIYMCVYDKKEQINLDVY